MCSRGATRQLGPATRRTAARRVALRSLSARALPAALLALALAGPTPVTADTSGAFVAAFAATCLAPRDTFNQLVSKAKDNGWAECERSTHPELAGLMTRSDKAMAEGRAEGLVTGARNATFARQIEGRTLHLVVTLVQSRSFDQIGCYLYDLDATTPVSPADVTRTLGIEPAYTRDQGSISTTVWGQPPAMGWLLDTYLTFVPPHSPHVDKTGFDGVALKVASPTRPGEGDK